MITERWALFCVLIGCLYTTFFVKYLLKSFASFFLSGHFNWDPWLFIHWNIIDLFSSYFYNRHSNLDHVYLANKKCQEELELFCVSLLKLKTCYPVFYMSCSHFALVSFCLFLKIGLSFNYWVVWVLYISWIPVHCQIVASSLVSILVFLISFGEQLFPILMKSNVLIFSLLCLLLFVTYLRNLCLP